MQQTKPKYYDTIPRINVHKSLNMKKRKQELIKITLENEQILKRLQSRKSHFSVEKWNKDFEKQSIYKELGRKDPYEFGNKKNGIRLGSLQGMTTEAGTRSIHNRGYGSITGTAVSGMPTSPIDTSQRNSLDRQGLPRLNTGNTTSNNPRYKAHSNLIAHQQPKIDEKDRNRYSHSRGKEIIKQANNLHPDRVIIFKQSKHIGISSHYVVEISNYEGKLNIAAFDTATPESLLICISADRTQFILDQFESDLNLLANSL